MVDGTPFEMVIGLEVHAQLRTATKLFCGDATGFGAAPNTQVSAISLAHPGTLPRMNEEAIRLALRLGLVCHCTIVQQNYFARKNYFYPDLPKGYQISQHTTPICKGGYVDIQTGQGNHRIRLNRIHIEEDAGKSVHDGNSAFTNLDFNRAGMPLLEIVTEPDLHGAEEAFEFVSRLRKIVRHLGVCDGNMEEGSLRCDVNISVRPAGDTVLGTKVEIKNLNSIRFIKKAITYEATRLMQLHREGTAIVQETRGFNEDSETTFSIRVKEDEDDYRYFPEPDLPPFTITNEEIELVRQSLPPLPEEVKAQLMTNYPISDYDAGLIAEDPELVRIFTGLTSAGAEPKPAANWTLGIIRNALIENDILNINTQSIAELMAMVANQEISNGVAQQQLFPALLKDPQLDIRSFVIQNDLSMAAATSGIDELVTTALSKHSEKIREYKKGKKGLLSLFVGEVMKLSKGKADAKVITEKVLEKLKED